MSSDVLRYWLAAIRHEEALGAWLRAAPRSRGGRAPNLVDPDRGQTYFKLPRDPAAHALLFKDGVDLDLSLADDRVPFFEHWLRRQYQRDRLVHFSRITADTDNDVWQAGFPVVYDSRRGQLFTLLQRPLHPPTWLTGVGSAWEPPNYRDRARGELPPPPVGVRVTSAATADTVEDETLPPPPPLTVAEAVLTRSLGVQEEQLSAFAQRLAGQPPRTGLEMVWRTIELLRVPAGEPVPEPAPMPEGYDTETAMTELTEVAAGRVQNKRLAVWPLGLVFDGGANYATHHLQRDLEELLSPDVHITPRSPLLSYLTGDSPPAGRDLAYGVHTELGPTPSQRDAAERFLGSNLTTVQGPPGTGKTRLILDQVAQVVVERAAGICAGVQTPDTPWLLVTSTNNRAVDNVTEPLSDAMPPERLPLALRVGSRMVMETVTLDTIARAIRWLQTAIPPAHIEETRTDFLSLMSHVNVEGQELREAWRADTRRAELETRRAACEAILAETAEAHLPGAAADDNADDDIDDDPLEQLQRITTAADLLAGFVNKATTDLTAMHSARRPPNPRRVWRRWQKAWPASLAEALAELDCTVDFTEPEEVASEHLLALLDRFAEAENRLADATDRLETTTRDARRRRDATAELDRVLAILDGLDAGTPDEATWRSLVDEHGHTLFTQACALREDWAIRHRDRLLPSLRAIEKTLRGRLSLRGVSQKDSEAWRDLRALFPVVGCTLLSIGNTFDLTEGAIERVIIDEAGQCHPAHAVSALHRAERALVIGDPYQLEPVVELNPAEEGRVLRRTGLHKDGLAPYRTTSMRACSAQLVAARACGEVPMLTEHFRCQPEIIAISNQLCAYDLSVRTPPASWTHRAAILNAPLMGLDVRGDQVAYAGSWRNPDEERVVVELVSTLVRQGVPADAIAVLTPYRGQLRALTDRLRQAGVPLDDPEREELSAQQLLFATQRVGGVAVGTVHRFQGGERDVVVFSTVIAQERSLPFLNQRVNLVNVAVSRARRHLVVVGNPAMLNQGPVTRTLAEAVGPRWITSTNR